MARTWRFVFLVSVLAVILAACGKTLEERTAEGFDVAKEAFYADEIVQNEEIDGTKFLKPAGFTVSNNSDGQNIILNKGKQPFILFINPNEIKDSRLFYDLLVANEKAKIISEEEFNEEDTFGFVAVLEADDGEVELIASVGGAKITTKTSEKNIASNLETMMQIVRSIE